MNLKVLENRDGVMGIVLLISAILCETFWIMTLRSTAGFTKLWPSVVNVGVMLLTVFCLVRTVRYYPEYVLYPIWTGSSIALVAIYSAVFAGEKIRLIEVFGIMFVIAGVVLLGIRK